MATTITLDEDASALVEQEARRAGLTAAEAVNRVLKIQLGTVAAPSPIKPFVVHPLAMNLPAEWTSGKVQDLMDQLDAQEPG
jgi:hypothetical protein